MSFALCALWEKTIWLSVFRIHGACLKVNCFCAFHVKIVKVDKAACEHRCLCGGLAHRSDPEHSRPDPYAFHKPVGSQIMVSILLMVFWLSAALLPIFSFIRKKASKGDIL